MEDVREVKEKYGLIDHIPIPILEGEYLRDNSQVSWVIKHVNYSFCSHFGLDTIITGSKEVLDGDAVFGFILNQDLLHNLENRSIDSGQIYFERDQEYYNYNVLYQHDGLFALSLMQSSVIETDKESNRPQEQDLFKEVFDNAKEAQCLIDTDGTLIMVNERFRELFRYTEDETDAEQFVKGICFDHRDDFFKCLDKLRQSDGNVLSQDSQIVARDGTILKCHFDMRVIHRVLGSKILITLNKIQTQQEKELQEISGYLNTDMAAEMKIGTWEVDMVKTMVSMDSVACSIVGIDGAALIDIRRAAKFIKSDFYEQLREQITISVETREVFDIETKILTGASAEKHVRLIGRPTFKDELLVSMGGIIQDINTKKETELKLIRASEDLVDFSRSVYHDLKAPLRSIIGFTNIFKESNEELEEVRNRDLLVRVIQNAEKMGDLIDDLIDYNRLLKSDIEFYPVDLKILFDKIINDTFYASKDFIEVGDMPTVDGDLGLLNRVVTNLISNAIKFSAKNENPRIEIYARSTPSGELISVKDNGVGFDPKKSEEIFKVFKRLHHHEDFEGSGMGLAICKKIIDLHKGHIMAEGEIDTGATFSFFLRKNSRVK